MAVVAMKQLLEAGVHFGHQTRRWDPKMAEYIFQARNGIHIIDLQKASKKIDEAYAFIKEQAEEGKTVLFVGTKKQAQECMKEAALNCGMYKFDPNAAEGPMAKMTKDMYKMYLGKDTSGLTKQIDVLGHITKDYPPTYVMTSYYDFLRENAEPMHQFLREKGVDSVFKCYGEEGQEYMGHVCHVNMNLDEAKQINQDEVKFFEKYLD